MNTTSKGNQLEDDFYNFLIEQQASNDLVFELYPPDNCKIFKKKSYYCNHRKGYVEFDVVIELYRTDRNIPHSYVIFECKHHKSSIRETNVTNFSHLLSRVFTHNAKGVIVTGSRLQSGAQNVALSYGMGIIKYDKNGFETIADRKGKSWVDTSFIADQIYIRQNVTKSLKFSAVYNNQYYGSITQLMQAIECVNEFTPATTQSSSQAIPYLSIHDIRSSAKQLHAEIGYEDGPVDLLSSIKHMSIDLIQPNNSVYDIDKTPIIGTADLINNTIIIYPHLNDYRRRFTIAHEIGHFQLGHGRYLSSDVFIESDLLIDKHTRQSSNYYRLEYQANVFASEFLLPYEAFWRELVKTRTSLDIRDRGHGFIFVDDQPCNFQPYNLLILHLSEYFHTSKNAIEIKLKNEDLLSDRRTFKSLNPLSKSISLQSFRRFY